MLTKQLDTIQCGDFYCYVRVHPDQTINLAVPANGEWHTFSGSQDELTELALRLTESVEILSKRRGK